jgi:hypothetical protein
MRTLFRRSMFGVASAVLVGFSFGCTGTTNDPNVAGAGTPGTPVAVAPKNLNEWAQQNKMMTPGTKGAAKSTPKPAPAK